VDGDLPSLRAIAEAFAAHTLKGAVLLFGARDAAAACVELEERGRRGTLDGAEELCQALEASVSLLAAEVALIAAGGWVEGGAP
jgi:HPt (histidine-containing phosphotransfer) domain-containing protein